MTVEHVLATTRRRAASPQLARAAEQAISLGQGLWQPAAAYEWLEVLAVDGECVRVAGPDGSASLLRVGPKADLLAPAQRLLAAVVTIGPALEETVRAIEAAGDQLAAYLLDSAGVVAVGAASEAIRCLAEDAAAEAGWGVSASLSPGSLLGWALEGQRELCTLVPLAEIGVRLNAHCVLEPHKSASLAVGLGPGYPEHKVGSVCKFCALSGTCWRRRGEAE
jgi:hypothetical protein